MRVMGAAAWCTKAPIIVEFSDSQTWLGVSLFTGKYRIPQNLGWGDLGTGFVGTTPPGLAVPVSHVLAFEMNSRAHKAWHAGT